MKSNLGLVLLALSAPAFAAQSTRLGDLNFFPKDKSIYWDTTVSMESGKEKNIPNTGNSGQTNNENELTSTSWNNRVLYALSDRLNVGASFNYRLKSKVENEKNVAGGASTFTNKSYEQTGLSDITLNGNYRFMDEKFYADIISGLTLGLGDANKGGGSPTASKDGNNKQGHHSLLIGAAAGQKINEFEWRATVAMDYNLKGERKEFDSSSNQTNNLDTDSFTNFLIRGDGQYRFMRNFAVAAFVQFNRAGAQASDGSVGGFNVDVEADAYNFWNYGLVGKYNFSERILVKLGATLTSAYDVKSSASRLGTSVSRRKEVESSSAYFLGGEFLF